MNKKKIVIISIFIVIVVGICLLLIFNGKENKKGYATVDEPDNFVVDTENKENVDIIDNIKINNSQKVKILAWFFAFFEYTEIFHLLVSKKENADTFTFEKNILTFFNLLKIL